MFFVYTALFWRKVCLFFCCSFNLFVRRSRIKCPAELRVRLHHLSLPFMIENKERTFIKCLISSSFCFCFWSLPRTALAQTPRIHSPPASSPSSPNAHAYRDDPSGKQQSSLKSFFLNQCEATNNELQKSLILKEHKSGALLLTSRSKEILKNSALKQLNYWIL